MKRLTIITLTLFSIFSFAQENDDLLALKKANDYIYQGNTLINNDNFISAEMAYRKAISEYPEQITGIYNLGNSYYKKGNYDEALYRHQQAAKNAISKTEKHNAFHNMGNVLMQNKKCKEAVEAYKNALRNDPFDEETRYNLALAKQCAEQQKDQNKDNKDKDKKDKDKDKDKKDDKKNQDNKDQDNKDQGDKDQGDKDQGDKNKKEEEDNKNNDEKPKDDKKNKDQGNKNKKQQKPQPGQLSPQQIKSLLEAMNNQEKKVQEKMNAEKQKGIKIKTEKDW